MGNLDYGALASSSFDITQESYRGPSGSRLQFTEYCECNSHTDRERDSCSKYSKPLIEEILHEQPVGHAPPTARHEKHGDSIQLATIASSIL